MNITTLKRIRLGLFRPLVVALVLCAPFVVDNPAAAQTTPPVNGVVCTTGTSPNPTFTLTAKDGYIILPDGNTMYMWSYANGNDAFQHPGPVLCVNQGDNVTVILQNRLPEDVSIIFPGQTNVLANGVPAQPQLTDSNNPASLTSLTNVAPANTGSVTYSFVAGEPGSYIYESGTLPQKQVRMGLFGALIVRPTMGATFAYNRADSQFTASEEFMTLLSEIDPYQHQAVESGTPFNLNNYHARYWLLNGRGFPDSIAPNYADWVPTQPYGALALIHPYNSVSHPLPGRNHFLNVGSEDYPFHPHGQNGLIIGRDGKPLAGPAGEDLSFEKFSVNIGPGQTWDVIFKWYDAESYSPGTPVPVTIPDVANMVFGQFFSGSPYLNQTGPLPPGASTLNQCGEYYIIAHNHALYQITSWGVNMSGPITYLRVNPPLPNSCPVN